MAAQRKKGKNSNKPKAANSGPAQSGDPKVAPAHADSVSVSGADPVEAASDNAFPLAEPLSTSEIETALTEPPAGRNSLDINTESETLQKLEGVDNTVAPDSDGRDLNISSASSDSESSLSGTSNSETRNSGTSNSETSSSEASSSEASNSEASNSESSSPASSGSETSVPASSAPTSSSSPSSKSATETAPSTKFSSTATLVAEKPSEPPVTGDYKSAPEFRSENFSKNEIKTLLVPVKPLHRLIACMIVIVCYSFLGYLYLNGPVAVNAHGLHTIDLPEAGDYLLIFKGDIRDAYGWTVDGRFRNSLEIDMEPVEPEQRVEKIEPIKDMSGADFFSVAEYEINQPGTYNLWVKWNDPEARCKGKISLEKDPVEKFIFKWAVGIIGTLALIFMCGIPMTTSKAQSTLEGHKTQA